MAAAHLGRAPDLPGPSILGFLACAVVVRRSAFLAVGGFDDVVFFGGEERVAPDLAAAGWGLAYVPDLVVHHHPSSDRDVRARVAREVRNRVLVACSGGRGGSRRARSPTAFAPGPSVGPASGPWSPASASRSAAGAGCHRDGAPPPRFTTIGPTATFRAREAGET
jgi:hypothetical protein